jgi:Lon protease-like protein
MVRTKGVLRVRTSSGLRGSRPYRVRDGYRFYPAADHPPKKVEWQVFARAQVGRYFTSSHGRHRTIAEVHAVALMAENGASFVIKVCDGAGKRVALSRIVRLDVQFLAMKETTTP